MVVSGGMILSLFSPLRYIPHTREHPNPESTLMYRFMQDLNHKHGLNLKVL